MSASLTRVSNLEKDLKAEIRAVGLDWRGVKKVLPDWADGAAGSTAGCLELRGFVLRHFGLALDQQGKLTRAKLPEARFKTTSGTSVEQVDAARSTATACARLIAAAVKVPWSGRAADVASVRQQICTASANGWVSLQGLLDYCWSSGVPVLYLPSLPTTGRKMEGMVTFVRGRPVIVLSKKSDQPDWMLFILAHELGHVMLGHIQEIDGQAIVDDTIDRSSANADVQEIDANKFAMSLLTPSGTGLKIAQRIPAAAELAAEAIKFGRKEGISPGHVILSAVRHTTIEGKSLFPLGQAALKHLPKEVTGGTTAELCQAAAQKYLDFDLLKYDSIEYLEKLRVL